MPSVFLVEDDPQTRARLVKAIEANPGFEVVGSAGTVAEGRAWLGRHFADVLLFDLGLPDGSGLDLIRLAARAGRGASRRSPRPTPRPGGCRKGARPRRLKAAGR